MDEILPHVPRDSCVLDLGSRFGSFDRDAFPFTTIRVDIEATLCGEAHDVVEADASRLPFRDHCFRAVICNHSLEHFEELGRCLRELGRVMTSDAVLYVAVPDADSVTDRLYRWVGRGGGHVNAFSSAAALAQQIEQATGLQHAGTRLLCTSLSFLNSKNWTAPPPNRLFLLYGDRESWLVLVNYLFRLFDRVFRTRFAVYGWVLYFGRVPTPISPRPWVNVCVRCGSGHEIEWLLQAGRIARRFHLWRTYRCPQCGTTNLLFPKGIRYRSE